MKIIKFVAVFLIMIMLFMPLSLCFAQNTNGAGKENLKSPIEIEKKAAAGLKTGKIMLNFEDIDVKVLAKLISEITGKNIIVDDKIQGKVTIVSSSEVSPSQAWKIFVSAVQTKGFSVIDKGSYVKIIPETSAKAERMKLLGEGGDMTTEDLVVAAIILKNADSAALKNSLSPLISPNGSISSYEPTNSLIISDIPSNVKRLLSIIKDLDVSPKKMELRIYYLKNVLVEPVAQSIEKTLGMTEKENPALNLKVSAHKSTNSLIVYGTKYQILQVEKLLKTIDQVKSDMERGFKVYYLENGDAEEIAKVVSNTLSEKKKIETAEQKTATPGEFSTSQITPDKSTNSLVMYVTNYEYESLKPLIAKLDAPRKQILVSAIIAEVSLKKLIDVGVRWQALYNKGAAGFMGGLSQEALYGTLASGNFILGALGQGATTITTAAGTTITYPNVFFLLSLLESDSDFNILSAPRLVTLDHLESFMNVGSVQPYASGVKFDSNQNPIITYDYKDVGLTLKVTPHISQSQKIRMDINQKLQEITDYLRPAVGQVSYIVPITSMREFKTNITVEDNQTVIVGGLVSKKTLETINKLPILSEIPYLGKIFQNKKTDTEKVTLFVFITPHIINNKEEYELYSKKYQEYLDKQLKLQEQRMVRPDDILPPEEFKLPDDNSIQLDSIKPEKSTPAAPPAKVPPAKAPPAKAPASTPAPTAPVK